MAARIFVLENKIDGTKTMFKAETKGQVNAFLRAHQTIVAASSMDVVDLMSSGTKVYDATSVVVTASDGDQSDVSEDAKEEVTVTADQSVN